MTKTYLLYVLINRLTMNERHPVVKDKKSHPSCFYMNEENVKQTVRG